MNRIRLLIMILGTVPFINLVRPAEHSVPMSPYLKSIENNRILSLEGSWNFKQDSLNIGIKEKWFNGTIFDETIKLPGTTDEQHKGYPEEKQTGRFTRLYAYSGPAWYQMEVNIPSSWIGKHLTFTMERTKVTKVWWDGQYIGEDNSLITTQSYYLGKCHKPGRHLLTVRVHNGIEENPPVGRNHQTADGTQTNWNGILGNITLSASDNINIKDVQVYPDIDNKSARIRLILSNLIKLPYNASLRITAEKWNTPGSHSTPPKNIPIKGNGAIHDTIEVIYPMGESVHLWDEFSPALYRLNINLSGRTDSEEFCDNREVDFGMRKFHIIGTNFAINGKRVFLRGKHDGAVFPITGYPPMDVSEWIRILGIIKSYGINHIRCHTWCPPKAAFEACDRLGIYLLPELPHWGAVGNKPDIVEGDVEQQTTVYDNTTEYLIKEGYRLLDEFGNHASFTMFEIGNELSGNRNAINRITQCFRNYDPRHLFAGGANIFLWNPQQSETDDFWTTTMTGGSYGSGIYMGTDGKEVRSSYPNHSVGHVNNILKGTNYDYSSAIKDVTIPVISHENGQYQMYPNYKEIDKFTGVTRAYNFETFKMRLEKAGMGHLADKYFKASGTLAALCYREDLESAIRTPGFGGFQMLDLQDFPGQGTALVGILDSFLDSKGIISAEEWRQFCSEVVPLLRYDKFTWTNDETFSAKTCIANYGPSDLNSPVKIVVYDSFGRILIKQQLKTKKINQGELTDFGEVSFSLNKVNIPQKLTITLSIPNTNYKNSYPIWVYPNNVKVDIPSNILVCSSLDEHAQAQLRSGGKVLLLPEKDNLKNSIDGAFQTDFWCYSMFKKYSPPGTLGILCDPKSPALKDFPTEFHSNWQWWRLLKNGRPINMDKLPHDLFPIVQVIDNVTTNRKLGVLFEASVANGKLLVCSMDLQEQQNYPECRQMLISLLNYMNSNKFNPKKSLSYDNLSNIFKY